jgi:hypothetical protein
MPDLRQSLASRKLTYVGCRKRLVGVQDLLYGQTSGTHASCVLWFLRVTPGLECSPQETEMAMLYMMQKLEMMHK